MTTDTETQIQSNANWLGLLRPSIKKLKPYQSARSCEAKSKAVGKTYLDANENPLKKNFPFHRYPDPQPSSLLNVFAKMYDVDRRQILIGRGSDEAIDILIRSFCESQTDEICICPPTYGVYEVAAQIQGCGVRKINYQLKNPPVDQALTNAKSDIQFFSLPVQEILQQWTQYTKILFVCSPNNPTGHTTPLAEIEELCCSLKGRAMIVVDEAYQEFSANESAVSLLAKHSHLVVLRTLSKAYGMAGLRVGVAIGNADLIAVLQGVRAPYPLASCVVTEVLSQLQAMESASGNNSNISATVSDICESREALKNRLYKTGHFSEIFPSEANFLLARAIDKDKTLELARNNGIVLRDRSDEILLAGCIRISIGSPEECDQLIEVLS